MTTQDDLMQSLAAEALEEQRRHEALIAPLHALREEMARGRREEGGLTERLKQYLALQGEGVVLYDLEHGLQASLRDRAGTEYDLRSFAQAEPGLLPWLAEHGAFNVNQAVVRALRKSAPSSELDTLERYSHRVITSTALYVEEIKEDTP